MINNRAFLLCVPLFVASCTQDVARYHTAAVFPERPVALIEGFESACSNQAETLRRQDAETAQCWVYLPPEVTASLILIHDGTHEDLPQLVLQLRITRLPDQRYRADLENFINIPQTNGPDVQIIYDDTATQRSIARMLNELGGEPIKE
ncbi:hypothetical protein OEZ49_04655 [Ruegeria sp. WL0004]|uniref:Lipoprotein n=1 Tax=Ruegeria marisflavi TaxID=2984152 RepID=A0ABT2WMH6_9RHOB|nr:hypothetical protein [Ruegeria sp. WL0004]MCU9837046.1 hypothetical protein [Ruegeria sp. WL0004]